MTEDEWLTSDDPKAMLEYIYFQIAETSYALIPGVPGRKLLLFAEEAGCPQCAYLCPHESDAAYAEYVAGASCSTPEKKAAILRDIFGNPFRPLARYDGGFTHWFVPGDPSAVTYQSPYQKWNSWNNGTIPALARDIYDSRAFEFMPILADALEEAGCTNEDILMHLRGWEPFGDPANPGWKRWGIDGKPVKHVRGCWVLDILLGKE